MIKKFKNILLALMLLGALSACDESKPCIDGDDFGMPKVEVPAEGMDIEGEDEDEVSKWTDSELVTDGSPVIFQAYGIWYPILLGSEIIVNKPCTYDGPLENPLDDTLPADGFEVADAHWPCFLTKGMGVYGVFMPTDVSTGAESTVTGNYDAVPNPNASYTTRKSPPSGNTFHLGDPSPYGLYPANPDDFNVASDPGGGAMPNKPANPGGPTDPDILHGPLSSVGDGDSVRYERLYFKILDSYYSDNAGAIVVKIRSGARSPYPGVFESMIIAISDIFYTVSETIYRRLVGDNDFVRAVHAMLVVFIAIYGLFYTMGLIPPETTQKVFLTKMIKFGIVVMLISPQSFEFFDQYLLKFFIEGLNQGIGIVSTAVSGPAASTSDRLTFFDDIFEKLFSQETQIKIWSLMWKPNPDDDWIASINVIGMLFIPILYIFIVFFAIALFKALLTYLMALITIGLLIAMAPIFIPFMLFERTKELFDGWLKGMIGTWIQPILLFTMLTLFYVMLMELLYETMGYRTCWNTWWSGEIWPDSGPYIDLIPGNLKAWMPNIRDKWDDILVPPFYYIDYDDFLTENPEYQTDFAESNVNQIYLDVPEHLIGADYRLVDYPALDPDDPVDADKLEDALDGTVTSFYDVLIFGIVIFLMYRFTDKVPQLARDMSGLTHSGAPEAAGGQLFGAISNAAKQGMAKTKQSLNKLGSMSKKVGGAATGAAKGAANKVSRAPSAAIGQVASPISGGGGTDPFASHRNKPLPTPPMGPGGGSPLGPLGPKGAGGKKAPTKPLPPIPGGGGGSPLSPVTNVAQGVTKPLGQMTGRKGADPGEHQKAFNQANAALQNAQFKLSSLKEDSPGYKAAQQEVEQAQKQVDDLKSGPKD